MLIPVDGSLMSGEGLLIIQSWPTADGSLLMTHCVPPGKVIQSQQSGKVILQQIFYYF